MKNIKLLLLTSLTLIGLGSVSWLLSSCDSHKKVIQSRLADTEKIDWPKGFKPAESGFFIYNEIDIQASPQVLWDIFVHAAKWPEWYSRAEGIKLLNSPGSKLNLSSVFIWNPADKFPSAIKEFNPLYSIGWLGETHHKKMTVYNAWLIFPTKDGCKVVSNETQNSHKTIMEKIFAPNMVSKNVRQWRVGLKEQAEKQSKN